MQKKTIGYMAENIVAKYYQDTWYHILETNYTIRGGEIDIIASIRDTIVFIEVKVINTMSDIHDFISSKKLACLEKTIQQYIMQKSIFLQPRLDIVFVKGTRIVEIFTHVTINN